MGIRGNNALMVNPYKIPIESTKDNFKKETGASSGVDAEAVWADAYNTLLSLSWIPEPISNWFWCAGYWASTDKYYAYINLWKQTITINPSLYITENQWNTITTLKLKIPRTGIVVGNENGGALKCVQSGDIVEQILGYTYIDISKGVTSYNEFDLTIEGLCRNINDLKPSLPGSWEEKVKGGAFPGIGSSILLSV